MLNRKPNRDLEDFFRRVQMTLGNRGGGGGAGFETSRKAVAPITGTTQAPQQITQPIPSWDKSVRDPGNYSGYIEGMRRLNGGAMPAPRPIQTRQPIPPYTSPGFPSPVPKPIVYDQIHRGNAGAPGLWNENTGQINPPVVVGQDPRTRQPIPRMRTY